MSLLLDVALHSPYARSAFFHLTLYAEQRNYLGENISNIVGGREDLSCWHGINNLESMGIPNAREHEFRVLNQMLLPIGTSSPSHNRIIS
jgi:hypothetical protein